MAPISSVLVLLCAALSYAQSSSSDSSAASPSTTLAPSSSTSDDSTSTTATSTTPYPSATLAIDPGSHSYTYTGCFNETQGFSGNGGARALAASGSTMNATDAMTVATCLKFCNGATYAGLEYGRECWCSPYLSSLSTELPAGACGIPCKANETTACGGSWSLSLYKRTASGAAGKHVVWSAVVAVGVTAVGGLVVGL